MVCGGCGRFVLKVQLLHAGGLSFVAEIPAAADRPTSVLKEDVAVALGSSALCDASMRALRVSGCDLHALFLIYQMI